MRWGERVDVAAQLTNIWRRLVSVSDHSLQRQWRQVYCLLGDCYWLDCNLHISFVHSIDLGWNSMQTHLWACRSHCSHQTAIVVGISAHIRPILILSHQTCRDNICHMASAGTAKFKILYIVIWITDHGTQLTCTRCSFPSPTKNGGNEWYTSSPVFFRRQLQTHAILQSMSRFTPAVLEKHGLLVRLAVSSFEKYWCPS